MAAPEEKPTKKQCGISVFIIIIIIIIFFSCPANEHQTVRCCQCDHEAPYIMIHNATPHDNTNEKGTWNISIKPISIHFLHQPACYPHKMDGHATASGKQMN